MLSSRPIRRIQPQISLSLFRVKAVTGKALARQNGPDVAIEGERLIRPYAVNRQQQQASKPERANRETMKVHAHEEPKAGKRLGGLTSSVDQPTKSVKS